MAMTAMTAVRVSSSNGWLGVVFTLDEQQVRFYRYWCVLEFEASCYWCSMQYEVVMSPSCAVQIHYNGDDGCAFIFVEFTERSRVGLGQAGRTFVLVCHESEGIIGVRCSMRS